MQTNDVASPVAPVPHPLNGASVLVTGGAGSFGQAFVRRALDAGARRVVIFSRDEAKQAAMRDSFNDPRLRFLIGDVRDKERLTEACRGVDIVVHAAALKRVEVCERDPNEAVATNVTGSQNVTRACIANGVGKAVLLSTDKAAAPNTIYGATKLAAERVWNGANVYAAGLHTHFAVTRYGNVIGSRGSVVPLFKAQAVTGTLTVTDADCSRFWMSMDAAVDLVVLALDRMRGGEVFIPKIGASSVLSIATAIAPKATFVETGLRPGEKLHECLVTEDEARSTYDCGSHYVIEPAERTWGDVIPLNAPKVPGGFSYRSDTAQSLTAEQIERLVAA